MEALRLTNDDRIYLDREVCKSFRHFIRAAWHVVDPSSPYMDNWHIHCLADHLEAMALGTGNNRLLFNVPPGSSKSTVTGVFFLAWLWGPANKPAARFIAAAHEATLATRDNRLCRKLIESEWFQERWPTQLVSDQNEKTYFETPQSGFRQSTAVASMTGKRGHVVLWDDPLNPEKAFSEPHRETALRVFKETLPNRLVDPTLSGIVIVMQRLHEDDPSGYILANDLGYDHVCIPMEYEVKHPHPMKSSIGWKDPRTKEGELMSPNRFPSEVVERDKKVMGSYATAGQNQQRPSPREGAIFKPDLIQLVKEKPKGFTWVRAWDLAATDSIDAARTAGVLMGISQDRQKVCFAHVIKIQGSPNAVQELLLSQAKIDGRAVRGDLPQDPGSAGKSWAMHLTATILKGYPYQYSPESGDKVTRALPLAAQMEAGNVMMIEAPWNQDFVDEIRMFPGSKFKDQVDAASRGYQNLIARPKTASVGSQR